MPDGPHIRFALVSPWMDQGTLFSYLQHNPTANRTKLVRYSFPRYDYPVDYITDIGRGPGPGLPAHDGTACGSSRYQTSMSHLSSLN